MPRFSLSQLKWISFSLFCFSFPFFKYLVYGAVKTAIHGCCSSVKHFKIFFSSSVFSEALKHLLSFNKALILSLTESVQGSVFTITP